MRIGGCPDRLRVVIDAQSRQGETNFGSLRSGRAQTSDAASLLARERARSGYGGIRILMNANDNKSLDEITGSNGENVPDGLLSSCH